MQVFLKKIKKVKSASIRLPASKSESNRALIINSLAGGHSPVKNLSEARDTQTMIRLLKSEEKTLDVLDAGTTMRFLTAWSSVQNLNHILTGTQRMQERPIGILVDALRTLGAKINYLTWDGFPPLETVSFQKQLTDSVSIPGNVSSQFISAILMIGPVLEKGLKIEMTGEISSKPYIEMTLGIMSHFGAAHGWVDQMITVPPQLYKSRPFTVQPDWSAASYWYSIVALASEAEIYLEGLSRNSFQGDKIIASIMENLGVQSRFDESGVSLSKKEYEHEFSCNFGDCPDLAQTVAVTAAARGIRVRMSGLKSLRIKETDRIAALNNELNKIGASLVESKPGEGILNPADPARLPDSIRIDTYDDHRMAMAFAPLATLLDLTIDNPEVVVKSYPNFWEDLKLAGLESRRVS